MECGDLEEDRLLEESPLLPGPETLKGSLPRIGGISLSGSVSESALPSLRPVSQQIVSYATRMAKSRDVNSSSKNRTRRAAYNSKVPRQLSDDLAWQRLGAVNALGKMKLEAGPHADLVVARLEDKDPRVRRRAVWALKEMTAGQLEPHKNSIAARLKHRDAEVRVAAAEIMGFMGKLALDIHGNNAVLLENCLRDEDAVVRRTAAEAFFKWGTVARPHVKALADALDDSDPMVRKLACMALGQLGRAALAHEAQLSGLLVDRDSTVRKVAGSALQQIRAI